MRVKIKKNIYGTMVCNVLLHKEKYHQHHKDEESKNLGEQKVENRIRSFRIISRFVNELNQIIWFKDGGCFSSTCYDEIVVIKSPGIMILEVSVPY